MSVNAFHESSRIKEKNVSEILFDDSEIIVILITFAAEDWKCAKKGKHCSNCTALTVKLL